MYLSSFSKMLFSTLLLLSLAITMFSCDFEPTAGHGTPEEDFPLFTMVAVNVVGGESTGFVNRLEEDDYGRIFFDFAVGNLLNPYFDSGIDGYAICQKIEDGYAYFYEDDCYIGAGLIKSITEEDIENLKENNDWEKEPNEHRSLSKVKSFTDSYDTNFFDIQKSEEENAKKHFGELNKISKNELKSYDICSSCRDENGKTLFYMASGPDRYKKGASQTSKLYAIIIDENGKATEKSILKIEDPYNCKEELKDFKLQNGWTKIN